MSNQYEYGTNGNSILIVDFQPIVREGLKSLIRECEDLKVCAEAENAHETMEVIRRLKPDMVIIDLSIRGVNCIEFIERIKQRYPKLPILVFTMSDESLYAERVFRAGANGYIMKHETLNKVTEAIYKVLRGGIYMSHKIEAKIVMFRTLNHQSKGFPIPIELLSNRELEVFRLIGQGYGTRRIAEKMFISIRTVESYRLHIRKKLKLKNGEELLRQAIQWIKNER